MSPSCTHCGHVFFKRRKPKKSSAPEIIDDSFSAGLTLEGGLMVFWYGRSEFTKFTPAETQLIRQMLAPKSVRDYAGDVPTNNPWLLPPAKDQS